MTRSLDSSGQDFTRPSRLQGYRTQFPRFPAVGRRGLVAFFRRQNDLFGFLLKTGKREDRTRFLRFQYAGMHEDMRRLWLRFYRRRAAWVMAGAPKDLPPWKLVEEAKT